METTDSKKNPLQLHDVIEKHVFNANEFIKYMQWTNILRNANGGERVCDFGCGDGALLELEYRNRTAIGSYIGIDNDSHKIEANNKKWRQLSSWANFVTVDLTSGGNDHSSFLSIEADSVIAFNVADSLSKLDLLFYLENFYMCGNPYATYYIRLPKATDLVSEQDIEKIIKTYFTVVNKFGVNGSIENFKPVMNEWQSKMYESLLPYYGADLVSAFMSPYFPDQCQQNLWILKRKTSNQL